jgi:hypothetical protein
VGETPPLNFLKNKEVERGAEGERWTVREAVLYLLLRLKILLILKSLMWLKVITICRKTIKASNNNKIVKDTFKVVLDIYTLAQS